MIGPILSRLLRPALLAPAEMRALFDALTSSAATEPERTALLVGLASRPLSPEELARAAAELRRTARPFRVPRTDRPVDLCGSGGAPRPSFNVSTVSAFVVAAAGAKVVKHGNRSPRGGCGSSDLLLALGLPVTDSTAFARRTYDRTGLAFLHAPLFHPATAAVREARKTVGLPTWFNWLGPLSNPAHVPYQVVGASDPALAALYSQVLPRLGVRRGATMSSAEGCDEFSPRRITEAFVWESGRRSRSRLRPTELLQSDERKGSWAALPPAEAAEETRRILSGGGGARRGSVLLTSGVALWAAGNAPTVPQGVRLARGTLDGSGPLELLERLVDLGRGFRQGGR